MNFIERFKNNEFEIVGKKKLPWQGKNTNFDIVKLNIEELKYNVLNGRIAELDLSKDVNLDFATYGEIKKSIVKQSKGDLEKLGKDIASAGLKEPLIINKNGVIIDGNRRYTAINMLLNGEIKPFKASDIADLEWVDTIILNADSDEQSVKLLEYAIQYDDMKKAYDPISRAFDFARSHFVNKISIAQIAEATGIKESEILKDIRTVKLIRVYLAAVGAKDNIALAIDLKLDGPFKEMASNDATTEYFVENQKELVDIITIAKVEGGDVTRTVRELVKGSAQTANKNIKNSPEVKKQVAKIATQIDVATIVQNAANAKTVAEKKEIITNVNEKVSQKAAKGIVDLKKSLVSDFKAIDTSKQIDKFLDFVQEIDFSALSNIDAKKLSKIKDLISENE